MNIKKMISLILTLGIVGMNPASFSTVSADTVPQLTGLEIAGVNLQPEFSPDNYNYMCTVGYSMSTVKVKAYAGTDYTVLVNNIDASNGKEVSVNIPFNQSSFKILVKKKTSSEITYYTISFWRQQDLGVLYKETTRPQFHFTNFMSQMGDPNGLVYDETTGEYHMYFQTTRPIYTGIAGLEGTTSWGHAVSTDLVNWKEYPIVISPDDLGVIFSGSCVIDKDNTSGLFDESTPPASRIVAFYSSHGTSAKYGVAEHGTEKISMAYSTDDGYTFTKYDNNPVVDNPGDIYSSDFRDPKVFWYKDDSYENGGIWVMIVGVRIRLFTSPDLKNWTLSSEVNLTGGQPVLSECPDLYPLPVDGDENNIKWVFNAAGLYNLIGELKKVDGKIVYTVENNPIQPVNAPDPDIFPYPEKYAAQSYYNDPSGRRITVTFLADAIGYWKDKVWNYAESLPLECSLKTVNGNIKLIQYPVSEINSLRQEEPIYTCSNTQITPASQNILANLNENFYDIEATFTLGTATEFGFNLCVGNGQKLVVKYNKDNKKLYIDKSASGTGGILGIYKPTMSTMDGNKIKLRILIDRTVFDVYGNEGLIAVSGCMFTELENNGMEFFATGGNVTIDSLNIYRMDSMTRFTLGDINEDKIISAADALLALQKSVNKIDFNITESMSANVNGDSTITASDALSILQYSVKKIDKWPVEE